MEAIILSEHMAHYCLAAPSLRRLLNTTLVDIFGVHDYVEKVRQFISETANYAEVIDMKDYTEQSHIKSNTTAFSYRASHRCDDMILKCMWEKEFLSCDKLFSRVYTQHGSCCVFNMMPKYILRNRS